MLNPFFSYFGSKYRLSKWYPMPHYNKIIEPFAGSAGYSLRYPDREVVLYEIYEPLILVWDYLINVKEDEFLKLPVLDYNKENDVSKQNIPEEAKILIGFWLTESQTSASRYPLSKSRGGNWSERKKQKLSNQLKYIRHWKIIKGSYEDIENEHATWFVDPPYEQAGKRYIFKNIDYQFLGNWCLGRFGEIIVCEQNSAKWMNFNNKILNNNGSNKPYHEVFYHRK